MMSSDQEILSQMIADIDYNVSQEGMSASYYRNKDAMSTGHEQILPPGSIKHDKVKKLTPSLPVESVCSMT
jgi:hypothetical protein